MKGQKSLRTMAKILEISPAYLSMILSGQRNPNPQLRDKLCSLGMLTSEARIVAHNPKVVGSNPTPATKFKAKKRARINCLCFFCFSYWQLFLILH